jgi:hypothetical protein
MESMFTALMEQMKAPLRHDRGLKTDTSILLIYPPSGELDFREYLLDTFVPELEAKRILYRLVDVTGFLFSGLSEEQIEALENDEFEDYRWMQQGLSKRTEATLHARLTDEAEKIRGGNVIVHATVALYPVVRYGEILRGLRDVDARIVLAFPGEERGGKLHFMNQADGANYLAVKLFAH